MTTTSESAPGKHRRALICGASGQDGAYLARLLLDKGYEVVATSRDAHATGWSGMRALAVLERVKCVSMALNDFRSVLQTVSRYHPDEIYNLAGQSSVGLSFEQPVEAVESIALGTLNLLETIRFVERPIRLYNAGSSECFGDTGTTPANELTPFNPRSPYAVAKACAHNLVTNYRDAYGIAACTGILFNHESPLRPERFVTQKIVRSAWRISQGLEKKLLIGNLDIFRDWGWAPDYVDAMWRMLQRERPSDYVIATGTTVSLRHFVHCAFGAFGLNWEPHVERDDTLLRPSDIRYGAADPSAAFRDLGWRATLNVEQIVDAMCSAQRSKGKSDPQ